ncbi:MAG TPA: porin, partial [Candidatus Aphodousia faecipullorum]|nr:porin [Candidatus Aphodousia faecipullorum]
ADLAKVDLKGYAAGVMYSYPLSKQTVIKAGVGYMKTEADVAGFNHTAEYENYNAVIGLLKYF